MGHDHDVLGGGAPGELCPGTLAEHGLGADPQAAAVGATQASFSAAVR